MFRNSKKQDCQIILAEYNSIRNEILQLNKQSFVAMSSSLAIYVIIMGWIVDKGFKQSFYGLWTLGVLILFIGNIMVLNRNRVAHRLALFQKYFIETRIENLLWSRVYFIYRNKTKGWGANYQERLADLMSILLICLSALNLSALMITGIISILHHRMAQVDGVQLANFLIALILVLLQFWLYKKMTDYDLIEETFKTISMEEVQLGGSNN